MVTLKLADQELADNLMGQANHWLTSTQGLFYSAKSTAMVAVAEYLANQKGYTLYESREGKTVTL